MKLLSSISDALQAVIDVTAKVFTKTVPALGETTFHVASMANDTVRTSRLEMLIENEAEIKRIIESSKLTEEDMEPIMKQLEY